MDDKSVACLIEIKSGEMTRAHIVGKNSFLIGRSKDATIPVLTVSSSRHHIRVDVSVQGITITDLNSNNGTFIDGARIQSNIPIKIEAQNIVHLGGGDEQFKFSLFPMPIEMMPIEERREELLASMNEIRDEIEAQNQLALENEKRKMIANVRNEQETAMTLLNAALNEKRKQVDEEIRKRTDNATIKAQDIARKIRDQSEIEAQNIITEATVRAQKISQSAQDQAAEIINEAQVQYAEVLSRAEKMSEEIHKDTSEKIKNEMQRAKEIATENSIKIEIQAKQNADQIIKQARLHAENETQSLLTAHKNELDMKKKSFEFELLNLRAVEVDKIRKTTLSEQEQIIANHRDLITKLKGEKNNIENEHDDLSDKCAQLKNSKILLTGEIEKMNKDYLEIKSRLTNTQESLNEAKDIIAKAERAKIEIVEIESRARIAKNNLEEYQKSFDDGMLNIEREFQSKKEKATLEYENMLKKKEEEYAKSSLESMGKLKEKILEEEKKYSEMIQMRAAELSNRISEALLPYFSELNNAKRDSIQIDLGLVSSKIHDSVNSVVVKNKSSIQAVTEHLGVDPEKTLQTHLVRKRWIVSSAAAAVLAVVFYWEPIYSYFKKIQNASGYVDYLLAKKSAESIYAPEQDDLWRETYSGNLLYLRNYHEAKTDPAYEDQWAILLNDVEIVRSLNLSEDDIVKYLGKEASLINELWSIRQSLDAKYLDEGLGKMNAVEAEAILALKLILKTEDNYEKVRRRERDFTMQYIQRRFGSSKRTPTNE